MVFAKFDQFLREVLKLPTAVFEGPSFGYTEHSVRTCFPQQVGIFEHPILCLFFSSHHSVYIFNNVHFSLGMLVFVSRRRSCWTHFWTCWWQILLLSVSYGYHSCTDLLMLKMVRSGLDVGWFSSRCVPHLLISTLYIHVRISTFWTLNFLI